MHIILLQAAVKQFHVATTTVNVLFMLHSELKDKRLVLVAEGLELSRKTIESGILGGLKTCTSMKLNEYHTLLNTQL